ncbi:MAG: hypothetical protein ACRDWF_12615, partial [Acidimicrobiia bacterium]
MEASLLPRQGATPSKDQDIFARDGFADTSRFSTASGLLDVGTRPVVDDPPIELPAIDAQPKTS